MSTWSKCSTRFGLVINHNKSSLKAIEPDLQFGWTKKSPLLITIVSTNWLRTFLLANCRKQQGAMRESICGSVPRQKGEHAISREVGRRSLNLRNPSPSKNLRRPLHNAILSVDVGFLNDFWFCLLLNYDNFPKITLLIACFFFLFLPQVITTSRSTLPFPSPSSWRFMRCCTV